MATSRQPSKILSQSEIKTAKAEALALLKTANAAQKAADSALAANRKSYTVAKTAAVKLHENLLKAMDKDQAAKDKDLVKASAASSKAVDAAVKALAKVSPAPAVAA